MTQNALARVVCQAARTCSATELHRQLAALAISRTERVPAVVSQPNCVAKGVARSGASIVIAPAVDMLGRGAESFI